VHGRSNPPPRIDPGPRARTGAPGRRLRRGGSEGAAPDRRAASATEATTSGTDGAATPPTTAASPAGTPSTADPATATQIVVVVAEPDPGRWEIRPTDLSATATTPVQVTAQVRLAGFRPIEPTEPVPADAGNARDADDPGLPWVAIGGVVVGIGVFLLLVLAVRVLRRRPGDHGSDPTG